MINFIRIFIIIAAFLLGLFSPNIAIISLQLLFVVVVLASIVLLSLFDVLRRLERKREEYDEREKLLRQLGTSPIDEVFSRMRQDSVFRVGDTDTTRDKPFG